MPAPALERPTHRAATTGVAVGCAGALAAAWLLLAPRTADLAAQVYRARLFARSGFVLWDNGWFAGHHIPGYSLVFPALAAVTSTSAVGVAAVLLSAVLFAEVVRGVPHPRRGVAVAWFACAAAGDLFIGRLTFALGVCCAVACGAALTHRRPRFAFGLGLLTAAASPVGGLLLGVVLVAAAPRLPREWRRRVVAAPIAGAGAMALAFPEGGSQPYAPIAAGAAVAIVLLVRWLTASERTVLRRAAALYAVAVVAAGAVPTPMGSNVTRLGILLAGPVLVIGARRRRSRVAVLVAAVAIVAWQAWGPVTEVVKARGTAAGSASYFRPLLDRLASLPQGRIEVVPTSTRWESVYVAPHHVMARGWETQLDRRYNGLFYRRTLPPRAYERWLHHLGVAYVAVSDAPVERWGRTERELLARRPGFLRLVWRGRHWRLFALTAAPPLADRGRLLQLTGQGFTLRLTSPGASVVRVRYTPFWHGPPGVCVEPAPGGFTRVRSSTAGTFAITAAWRLRNPFGAPSRSCPARDG